MNIVTYVLISINDTLLKESLQISINFQYVLHIIQVLVVNGSVYLQRYFHQFMFIEKYTLMQKKKHCLNNQTKESSVCDGNTILLWRPSHYS